jgi:Fe-S cluster biogenesis protein NfuA
MQEPRTVVVYMEQTPNPAALKFVTNAALLVQGSAEFTNKQDALASPLAYSLFDFTGVRSVFIAENFVTVTKTEEIEWWDIQNIIREYIRSYLVSGDDVFNKELMAQLQSKPRKTEIPVAAVQVEKPTPQHYSVEEKNAISEKIMATLDEYVKPAVAQDGGAIDFKSFEDGIVTLVLKGSCSGCPSSTITLKHGIERVLKSMIPQVSEVIAES